MIARLIRYAVGRLRPRYWYAVKHRRYGWLVDANEAHYSVEFGPAVWFDEPDEVVLALRAAHLDIDDHTLVRLHVQANTNHYAMKDQVW